MRMFTEVGRRVKPHATAVGKAILATKPDDEVRELLKRTGMPRRTEHTLTTPKLLFADLERVRECGYALDNGEQELGVRCVALAVPGAPRPMALSMSGPLTRMSDAMVDKAAPILRKAAEKIGSELSGSVPLRVAASAARRLSVPSACARATPSGRRRGMPRRACRRTRPFGSRGAGGEQLSA